MTRARCAVYALVAAMALLSGNTVAGEGKLSDPTDQALAAKGCSYHRVLIHDGQSHPQGEVLLAEGQTGRRGQDYREWQCHNGRLYWKDTGAPVERPPQ